MIYLFSCCGPLKDCIAECKFSCGNWFNKPLGPYVVLAMLLSGYEISQCLLALLDEGLKTQCVGTTANAKAVGVETWLCVQFGLAFLNFMFAPYIQFRLWQNLQEEAAEMEEDQRPGEAERFAQADAFVDVPRAKVKEAFWNVFLYDLGVCAYVFALFGSGFWSFLGTRWFDGQPFCDPDGFVSTIISTGSFFVIFVTVYFIGFTFYMNFMATMEVNPSAHAAARVAAAGGYALAAHAVPGVPPVQQGRSPVRQGSSVKGGRRSQNNNQQKPIWQRPLFGAAQTKRLNTQSSRVSQQKGVASPSPQVLEQKVTRTPMERALHPAMMIKLIACLGLDLMGDATYFLPGLGEGIDLAYAPAQAIALKMMFNYNALPIAGFTEEILPGTDIIPSATIGWLLQVCAPDNSMTRAVGIRSAWNP